MSQVPVKVKYVPHYEMVDADMASRMEGDFTKMIPVVELSALREVVEGLKAALNLLKYYADKADDPACSYVEREIQSLLASLGEVGK